MYIEEILKDDGKKMMLEKNLSKKFFNGKEVEIESDGFDAPKFLLDGSFIGYAKDFQLDLVDVDKKTSLDLQTFYISFMEMWFGEEYSNKAMNIAKENLRGYCGRLSEFAENKDIDYKAISYCLDKIEYSSKLSEKLDKTFNLNKEETL